MAEKYRIEISDIKAIEWRISIGESSFSGSYTSLKATGNPLRFSYDNNSDDVFDPIRPSFATFEVYSETNFVLQDLYSVDDKHFTVDIYQNDTLYWKGFIQTQNYREVYEPVEYAVSIKATDGLSLLQNVLYADDIVYSLGEETITYFNGRQKESKILLDILAEIDHTSFYEFVNLYEDDMLATSADSPFDQIEIDTDVFRDWYCSEVLAELLKKYNAFIRQRNGVFYIVRPTELIDTSVYGRLFTGATTKSSVTLEPDQFIKRKTTHPSSRRIQVPGGELMVQAPAKKVSIFQDYGNKQSWLDNHSFLSKWWNGTDFDSWTRSREANLIYALGSIAGGETEGVYLYNRNTYPTLADYIYQSFGGEAIVSTYDVFNFEIDYLTRNAEATERTDVKFYIRIKCDAENQWLAEKDTVECEWKTTAQLITITTTAPAGVSAWSTWKRTISGLPAAGPYTIYIYNSDYADNVHVAVKNVRFYSTSDEIVVKTRKTKGPFPKLGEWILMNNPFGKDPSAKLRQVSNLDNTEVTEKEYHVFNNISGEVKEYDYKLGDVIDANMDNVIEQCAGSLGILKRTNAYRIDTITLTGTSGTANIVCDQIAHDATFNGNLGTTASDFVTAFEADYLTGNVVVTSAGADIIFTSNVLGAEFSGDTTIQNDLLSLDGTVELTHASYDEALEATNVWAERGSVTNQPLLEFIANEIADVYERPKQLIQMPILETAQGIQVDVIGNIQDDLNLYGSDTRVFVINRGEFDVRNRKWEVDIFEVGVRAAETEAESLAYKYGALYNWYAATDVRNICASGWHVPTYADYLALVAYNGGVDNLADKLRLLDEYWDVSTVGGTNEYNFNSRAAGFRNHLTGAFGNIQYYHLIWLSNSGTLYYIEILNNYHDGSGFSGTGFEEKGISVRPIKDSTTLSHGETGTYTGNDGKVYRTICIGTQEWVADNLCETKYRNGEDIPVVTDNAAWAALGTGAMCYYNNDITNAYETGLGIVTVDSTLVSADSDLITVDNG